MDVVILGGFLGSGKTTILLQIIEYVRARSSKETPVAVIENEIGSVSVDGDVIAGAGYAVKNMLAGCACCTLLGELPDAVRGIQESLDPDVLVIEATGVAVPESMREIIERYTGRRVRVCVVADASRWRRMLVPMGVVLGQQLKGADLVCVNKVDLVDEDDTAFAESSVREMAPDARIVRTSAASALPEEVLASVVGAQACDCDSAAERARNHDRDHDCEPGRTLGRDCDCAPGHDHDHGHDCDPGHDHAHDCDRGHDHAHDHARRSEHPLSWGELFLSESSHDETAVVSAGLVVSEGARVPFSSLTRILEEIALGIEGRGGVVGHIKASVRAGDAVARISVTQAAQGATFVGSSIDSLDADAEVEFVAIASNIEPAVVADVVRASAVECREA